MFQVCNVFLQSHNPEYLTDVEEEDDDATHWQSVTMDDQIGTNGTGMQNLETTKVNLTMSLGMNWSIRYNLLVTFAQK